MSQAEPSSLSRPFASSGEIFVLQNLGDAHGPIVWAAPSDERAPLSALGFHGINAHDHRYGAPLVRNALDDQPRLLAYGERQERFC